MAGPVDMDDKALGMLIRLLNPYSNQMEQPTASAPTVPAATGATGGAAATPTPGGTGTESQTGRVPRPSFDQFQVEIDDYYSNFTSGTWTFRGQPQTIKKALRVTYRYPVTSKDSAGQPHTIYITEHLLIGYAGSNSG